MDMNKRGKIDIFGDELYMSIINSAFDAQEREILARKHQEKNAAEQQKSVGKQFGSGFSKGMSGQMQRRLPKQPQTMADTMDGPDFGY